jgi:hypothetical protein
VNVLQSRGALAMNFMKRTKIFDSVAVEVGLVVVKGEAEMKSSKAEVAMRKNEVSRIGALSFITVMILCFALTGAQSFAGTLEDGYNVFKVGSKDPQKGIDEGNDKKYALDQFKANDLDGLFRDNKLNMKSMMQAASIALSVAGEDDGFLAEFGFDPGNTSKFESDLLKKLRAMDSSAFPALAGGKRISKEAMVKLFEKLFKIKSEHKDWFVRPIIETPETMKKVMALLLDDKDEPKLAEFGLTLTKVEDPKPEVVPPAASPTIPPVLTDANKPEDRMRELENERRDQEQADAIRAQCAQMNEMKALLAKQQNQYEQEYNNIAQIAAKLSNPKNQYTNPTDDSNDFRTQLAQAFAKSKKADEHQEEDKATPKEKEQAQPPAQQVASRREPEPSIKGNDAPENQNLANQQQQPPFNPYAAMSQPAAAVRPPPIVVDMPDPGNADVIISDANRYASQLASVKPGSRISKLGTNPTRLQLTVATAQADADLATINGKISGLQSEEDRITKDLSAFKRAPLTADLQKQRNSLEDQITQAKEAMNPMSNPQLMFADAQSQPLIMSKLQKSVSDATSALKQFDADVQDKTMQKNSRAQMLTDTLGSIKAARTNLETERTKLTADDTTLTTMTDQAYQDAADQQRQMLASLQNGGNNQRRNVYNGMANNFQNGAGRPSGLGGAMGANLGASTSPNEMRRPLSGTMKQQ